VASVASADIYKLAEAMRESAATSEVTTMDVLVHSANYLKSEMEARVPVKTGRLRQSIQVRPSGKTVVIGPDTEYAGFVEFGTGPHVIKAKKAKALSFYIGGQQVIVKQVNHPGSKAKPFVRPAFEAWVDTLGGLVAEAHVQRLAKAAS
jgi:HK97 gp10 family phage protein